MRKELSVPYGSGGGGSSWWRGREELAAKEEGVVGGRRMIEKKEYDRDRIIDEEECTWLMGRGPGKVRGAPSAPPRLGYRSSRREGVPHTPVCIPRRCKPQPTNIDREEFKILGKPRRQWSCD
jgi:hypothetical protein